MKKILFSSILAFVLPVFANVGIDFSKGFTCRPSNIPENAYTKKLIYEFKQNSSEKYQLVVKRYQDYGGDGLVLEKDEYLDMSCRFNKSSGKCFSNGLAIDFSSVVKFVTKDSGEEEELRFVDISEFKVFSEKDCLQ